MGRIMAVDYGRKRAGIAVSDPMQMIATGLETVAASELLARIERYMASESVERIVVGHPLMLDGTESDTAVTYVLPFVARLKKRFPDVTVELSDERYTSKMAVNAMVAGGMKKKDRRDKANIDKVSATILLQYYLEQTKYRRDNGAGSIFEQ